MDSDGIPEPLAITWGPEQTYVRCPDCGTYCELRKWTYKGKIIETCGCEECERKKKEATT